MTKRMTDDELNAWLGDDWTDEQRDKIATDWRVWEGMNPDADEDEGAAMLTAIAQHHDKALTIPNLTEVRREARAAVVVSVTLGGMSEAEAARAAGVDRMTVRSWLGKR
jgi:DNA-directed RNA polymerase specialized sigma24 family protein